MGMWLRSRNKGLNHPGTMLSIRQAASPLQQQNAPTSRSANANHVAEDSLGQPRLDADLGAGAYANPHVGVVASSPPPDGLSSRLSLLLQGKQDSGGGGLWFGCGLAGGARGVRPQGARGVAPGSEREAEPRMLRPFIGRVGLLCFCLRPQGVRLGKHNAFYYPPPLILNDSVGGRGGRCPLRLCSGRRMVGA